MDWTTTAAEEEEVIVISSDSDGDGDNEEDPRPVLLPLKKPSAPPALPSAADTRRGRGQPLGPDSGDDDDELLDPDGDDIFTASAWPTFGHIQPARPTSPTKSSSSEESTSPIPSPVKKPKAKPKQLAPAKITFPKPQSKAPAPISSTSTSKSMGAARVAAVSSEEEDEVSEEEDDPISYRITKKNPNPQPQSQKPGKKNATSTTAADKKAEAERAAQQKKAEREKRKANEAREKELKKNVNELRKNSKPGEAFKFMTVLLDPNFPHKEAVEKILDAAEVRYANSDRGSLLLENAILFERETVYQAMGDDLQLHKRSRYDEEDQLFIYLEPEEIVPKVAAQMRAGEDWSEAASAPRDAHEEDDFELDFVTYVSSLQSTFPKKIITLVLYGMDGYFKKIKKNQHQDFRQKVLNGDGTSGTGSPKKRRRKKGVNLPSITHFDFQSSLIELQLKTGVNYRILNSAKDLGLLLVQYTKAIADAPFKRAQRELSSFDWYALADTSGSIRVDKEGGGLSALWIEQLQQFNKIGVDSAMAIVRKYSTPRELMEAYESCRSQEEGQGLLKDISVRTGFGPLQKTRKLGPEASKKVFRFFTSTDPERCLGSTTSF